MTARSPLFAQSLAYAARGWAVFSIQTNGLPWSNCERCVTFHECPHCRDRPAGAVDHEHLLCHAYRAGTVDAALIEEMHKRYPVCGIGIATGVVSRLLVVDADVHQGGADGLQSLKDLIASGMVPGGGLQAITGGGGRHVYLRLPDGSTGPTRIGWRPGVDVKGDGGYVVAPPTQKANRPPYRFLDGAAAIQQAPPELLAALAPAVAVGEAPALTATPALFALKLDELAAARVGHRNRQVWFAGVVAGGLIAAGEIERDQALGAIVAAARECGCRPDEATRTALSGITRGMRDGGIRTTTGSTA